MLAVTIAFVFASSAVYIFNDFCDRQADKLHPAKRHRPLAAGTIRLATAFALCVLLVVAAFALAAQVSLIAAILVAAYLANNILYSLSLKHVTLIDIFQIALGLMLRILTGTIGVGIFLSEWLVVTGFIISLLIGFAKRYAERVKHDDGTAQRQVLQHYSTTELQMYIVILAAATIMAYALYTLSPRSIALHGHTRLIYTIPLVVFGVFRFVRLVLNSDHAEDPATLLLRDRQLALTVLMWLVTYGMLNV